MDKFLWVPLALPLLSPIPPTTVKNRNTYIVLYRKAPYSTIYILYNTINNIVINNPPTAEKKYFGIYGSQLIRRLLKASSNVYSNYQLSSKNALSMASPKTRCINIPMTASIKIRLTAKKIVPINIDILTSLGFIL